MRKAVRSKPKAGSTSTSRGKRKRIVYSPWFVCCI